MLKRHTSQRNTSVPIGFALNSFCAPRREFVSNLKIKKNKNETNPEIDI